MSTEAPRAGTEHDDDEEYLSRLLLLHPDLDDGWGDDPEPTVVDAAASPPVPPGLARTHPGIRYDGDGWVTVVPDEPDPVPEPAPIAIEPPPPPAPVPAGAVPPETPWWRRNLAYIGVVALIALVVAGMALAPGGDRPRLLSGAPSSTAAKPQADPLEQQWRLDEINLQFSEVEEGYVQVFDEAIDPVGTDGCTQPTKADGVVASTSTAYAYRPEKLAGFAAGHVASMITVFRDADAAQARAAVEREPEYLTCLSAWDEATWFGNGEVQPKSQEITPVPAALEGRTLVGARYTGTYDAPDGGTYAAYTDHIVVTTGRVRVWIELSSVLYPFDAERRDQIVDGVLERLDGALR